MNKPQYSSIEQTATSNNNLMLSYTSKVHFKSLLIVAHEDLKADLLRYGKAIQI